LVTLGVALENLLDVMNKTDNDKTPNPVDLYVGGRIRMRRRTLGVSQEKLAEDLGLTFQQVQKYERGANRVSASKLYEIARSLSTPVSFFFEGLNDPTESRPGEPAQDNTVHDFLMTNEGLELAAIFPKVRRPKVRRRLLDLVRAMSEEEELEGVE
jgi:transcriptional regulator with XRE-family HTH domain